MIKPFARFLLCSVLVCIGSNSFGQELPKSLFPNQQLQDITTLLQNKNENMPIAFETGSITNEWTLIDAVALAAQKNLELAQSKKDLDSAKSLYTGSIQDFYVPQVGVSLGASFTTNFGGTSIGSTSPMGEGFSMDYTLPSLTISKTIFSGMRNFYSHRIAKENYLNAQNVYTNKVREIIFETASRYYNQFLKQEEVNVAIERLKQLQDQLTQAQINFQNGRVSDYDVSLSLSQFYAAQPTFYTAEKNRLFAQEDFYRYIGYKPEPDTVVYLKGELLQVTNVEFSEFDEEESLNYIFTNDTILANLRAAANNAKSQKGLENAARLPTLDVGFFYNPSLGGDKTIANFSEAKYRGSYGVQASLQIPIIEWIPGTGVATRVKAAEATAQKSQIALLDAEEQKLLEVKNNLLSIRELGQSVDAFRISEESALRASEIARAQYQFGRISLLELNQAQVDYIDTKRNLLNAVYNELVSKLTLQVSINKLPSFLEEVEKIQNNSMASE